MHNKILKYDINLQPVTIDYKTQFVKKQVSLLIEIRI